MPPETCFTRGALYPTAAFFSGPEWYGSGLLKPSVFDNCDLSITPRSTSSKNQWSSGPEGELKLSSAPIIAKQTHEVAEISDTCLKYTITKHQKSNVLEPRVNRKNWWSCRSSITNRTPKSKQKYRTDAFLEHNSKDATKKGTEICSRIASIFWFSRNCRKSCIGPKIDGNTSLKLLRRRDRVCARNPAAKLYRRRRTSVNRKAPRQKDYGAENCKIKNQLQRFVTIKRCNFF